MFPITASNNVNVLLNGAWQVFSAAESLFTGAPQLYVSGQNNQIQVNNLVMASNCTTGLVSGWLNYRQNFVYKLAYQDMPRMLPGSTAQWYKASINDFDTGLIGGQKVEKQTIMARQADPKMYTIESNPGPLTPRALESDSDDTDDDCELVIRLDVFVDEVR